MRAFNRPKKPKHEIKAAYKRRIRGYILYTKGSKSSKENMRENKFRKGQIKW